MDCLYYSDDDEKEIAKITQTLTYADGAPIWAHKLKDTRAPKCILTTGKNISLKSIWKNHENDEPEEVRLYGASFGTWSVEQRFAYRRTWKTVAEQPGLGRFEGDDFQDYAAQALVANGGGVCVGQGGSGKSEILKRVKALLLEAGWDVHVVAFTHVASANCGGDTILRELHGKINSRRCAILVDEISMVSIKLWSALANMQMTGNHFWLFGDCEGQFLPIQDQHRTTLLEGLDRCDFIHDLTNGLRVEVKKYRRGTDQAHFNFVGSVYGTPLDLALERAKEAYPARGEGFEGVTLVVDHRRRMLVNEQANRRMAPASHVMLKAGAPIRGCANHPQNMRVWVGLI